MIGRHREIESVRRAPAFLNLRRRTLLWIGLTAGLLLFTVLGSLLMVSDQQLNSNLELRNAPPSWEHPFGTDWLGRDMLARTLRGLTLSLGVGLTAALCSVGIAFALGLAAAVMGRTVDRLITWLIDLFLSVPHLITLILIAFVMGGGVRGVVIGIAFTHWPSLARVIRAEVLQLRSAHYVHVSRKLGKNKWWIAMKHMVPHVLPQCWIGLLLIFPHAILHEAAITFLGMGLSPHQPAIGIILSESMRYLSIGMWWLAFFPGMSLVMMVMLFDRMGENVRRLMDPKHERLE
ncbi:ABC transporter permease [Marinicrinis lubricantis]|uniref:ABC transporter permease n=1 Tax=Marinicrinis lubricantis TaxID=2086470 RepID=A0ABW1IV38_9BACL